MDFKEFSKLCFILGLMLVPSKASASYWLECVGLVTIKSDAIRLSEATTLSIKTDFEIHDHTFTCKGHGNKIDVQGIKKDTDISIANLTSEKIIKNDSILQVKYSHVNSLLPNDRASKKVAWAAIKLVTSLPTKKPNTKQIETKKLSESTIEGVDMSIEEALWEKYEPPQTVAQQLTVTATKEDALKLTPTYRGNLFEITYPEEFSATPLNSYLESKRLAQFPNSELSADLLNYVETDEAYFTSADGSVTFFIFLHDTTTGPKSYTRVAKNEIELSKKSDKYVVEENHFNYLHKAWVTLKDKNNAYYRSYIHQRACHHNEKNTGWDDCETKVLGIQYPDTETYNEYRDLFIKFHRSLVRAQ